MSNQEQGPQPEHLDTLDVLQAIVEAWRHLNALKDMPAVGEAMYNEAKARYEALEKAMEMGRRHLEQEGRL